MASKIDALSEKFSRSYKVLTQLYPGAWDAILDRFDQAIARGLTASKAIRAVNLCKGLAEHHRLALIAALAADRREIRQRQASFHTPLTVVTVDQLLSGVAPFSSYLSDSSSPRRSVKHQLPLTDPRAPKSSRR